MHQVLTHFTLIGLLLSSPLPAQQKPAADEKPKAAEELTKPESDRGDPPLLRQQSLSLSLPDRDQLRQRIETALRKEGSLRDADLTVNVSDDAIDVSGNAATNKQRLAARRIVQSFAGNMRVRERISVAGAAPSKRTAEATPSTPRGPGQPSPGAAPRSADAAKTPESDPKRDGDKSQNPRL